MRVLLCIKNGVNDDCVVNYYTRLLHRAGDEVVLLHVADPIRLPAYVHAGGVGYIPGKAEKYLSDRKTKHDELKKKYETMCLEFGISHKFVIHDDKDGVGETIVSMANKSDVNLIIMGSRGLGIIGRIILGSVDDYVKQHCKIPTLICPSFSA